MKTLILSILMLILFQPVTKADDKPKIFSRIIADEILDVTHGYIFESHETDDWFVSRIKVSDYYTFDMVSIRVNRIINEYNDVSWINRWEIKHTQDGYYYMCSVISDEGYQLAIGYTPDNSLIHVYGFKK